MVNLFPFLVANAIGKVGCHQSVAERVYLALCDLPEEDSKVLWFRLQGESYGRIAKIMDMNKGMVWKIINGPIKRSIYSVIEKSTLIPETAMVS